MKIIKKYLYASCQSDYSLHPTINYYMTVNKIRLSFSGFDLDINRIIEYILFIWLLSVTIMFMRFIHIAVNSSNFFHCIAFFYMNKQQFINPFYCKWLVKFFQFGAIIDTNSMTIHSKTILMYIFCLISTYILVGYIPGSKTAGSKSINSITFKRYYQTIFQSSSTTPPVIYEFGIPHPHQYLKLSFTF